MELKNLVIRELQVNDQQQPFISDLGGSCNTDNPFAQETVASLNSALARRATLTHGAFNPENEAGQVFIKAFEEYIASEQNAADFLTLADIGIDQLAVAMSKVSVESASSGYVIFSQFQDEKFEYLLVGLVRNRTGISFNEELNPTEVREVDLGKLHQAAKINITSYSLKKDSYLSFLGGKDKTDAAFFANAFGCTDVVASKKSTSELIRAARDFCTSNGMSEKREQVVEDVVSYLSAQRSDKQSANLPDVEQILNSHVPNDRAEELTGTFSKFANGNEYSVSQEFQPHNHTLTAITKVKAKADNWSLDFAKKSLGPVGSGKDIEFDEQTNSILLKRLPSRVIEQIKQAMITDDQDA
ncbi:MAG: nucleoid-associated protein NdpA [Osedax symbiont Rs1]|nr:MAG: nucleoid-associated protein NdpA [Osedax symbiont Rs1]